MINYTIEKIFQYSFFICLIAIEYLATTTQEIQVVVNSWDKANHFIAFMMLYILLSLGYKHIDLFFKVTILFLFAIEIEVVQYFIPGREFSLLDIVADMIGVGIGYIVIVKKEIKS
jgi:VanZ family protein